MKVTRKNVWMLNLEQNSDTSKLQNIDYNLVPKFEIIRKHRKIFSHLGLLFIVLYKKDLHAIAGLVNGRR